MKRLVALVTIIVAAGVWYVIQPQQDKSVAQPETVLPEGALVAVTLPAAFTDKEQMGKRGYDAVCASCHGANGQGQDGVAPPLVHRIYEPGHHGDMAFVLAAKNGVRGHHWPFGNMPPIAGLT